MPTPAPVLGCRGVLVGIAAPRRVPSLEQRALSATTTGRILSGETVGAASRGQSCQATVAYRVDGLEYHVDGLVKGACPTNGAGARTQVRYDPGSPGRADTREPSQALVGIVALAVLGALFCAFLLARRAVAARRRRGRPEPDPESGAPQHVLLSRLTGSRARRAAAAARPRSRGAGRPRARSRWPS